MALCCRPLWRSLPHGVSLPPRLPLPRSSLRFTSSSTLASPLPSPSPAQHVIGKRKKRRRRPARSTLIAAGVILTLGITAYEFVEPFRHFAIAIHRCTRVGIGVLGCIVDYKLLFRKSWPGEEEEEGSTRYRQAKDKRHQDYSDCHRRCAERILKVLQKNGGIYVKLGQHLSSVQLIPIEWSSTMRPLQDQCTPTPMGDLADMYRRETGAALDQHYSDFDPVPLGVASLAQVHRATDRASGKRVAVKIMHPGLEDFANIDMRTTSVMLDVVKRVFPTFEFTWLGEEMRQNLPKEMDFVHEADNAMQCRADFAHYRRTALVIPDVLRAQKRILVMEYIEGGRVDDLEYLDRNGIDRDRVSQELARIFSQMIYLHGFFHGDPHAGNLLIRPARLESRSPYNFELVLLDHGLYFGVDSELRTNYARLWLSFFAPLTPKVRADRRKYARLVGNIGDDDYAIFESAITGRTSSEIGIEEEGGNSDGQGSFLSRGAQSAEEAHRLRTAVVEQEGLLEQIFAMLRGAPRTVLMILKINDLTRSLDVALQTRHPPYRVWVVTAQYCAESVYLDDLAKLRASVRHKSWRDWFSISLAYAGWTSSLWLAAHVADWIALFERWRRKLVGESTVVPAQMT